MPSRLSEVFDIPQQRWDETGAFDAFIGLDARLHIDPFLLDSSAAIELADAKKTFDTYFSNIVRLLTHSKTPNDPFFREAVKRLTFREIPNTGLGYSKKGRQGSGIGAGLATEIASLGKLIIDAGVADPEIFSLMGLLQDDIGADRISDMTAAIILENLLGFTDRVVSDLGIDCVQHDWHDKCFRLPADPTSNEKYVLVPVDILRDLPVAFSWNDIDIVCAHNRELRDRVNSLIGDSWKDVTRLSKPQIREILLSNPDLIRDLLEQYKRKEARSYDLHIDPKMLYSWQPVTRQVAAQNPLLLSLQTVSSNEDYIDLVRKILTKFKSLVESNRLYRLLYNDDGTPRREKASQLALFGIADAYCEANDLDLSPEADAGNGPVDFKFSRGYKCKILAEVKLSSNTKLVEGYDHQVGAYESAEQSHYSFYIAIIIGDHEAKVGRLVDKHNQFLRQGGKNKELIIIDAREKPSASNR